jgi:hypothetical protein
MERWLLGGALGGWYGWMMLVDLGRGEGVMVGEARASVWKRWVVGLRRGEGALVVW